MTALQRGVFDGVPGWELGEKSAPALIVIQEWWGITDDIKEIAENYHREHGYRVMIPDIYNGKVGLEVAEAKHLMEELDWVKAKSQVVQLAKYLRKTGSPKVGSTGYCMGGGLTIGASAEGVLDCGVPCYGVPTAEHCDPAKCKTPLQGHYGVKDSFVPVEKVKAFVEKVNSSGGNFELHFYEDAGHAFLNPKDQQAKTGQPHPSQKTIDLAWKRSHEYLAKHLKN